MEFQGAFHGPEIFFFNLEVTAKLANAYNQQGHLPLHF